MTCEAHIEHDFECEACNDSLAGSLGGGGSFSSPPAVQIFEEAAKASDMDLIDLVELIAQRLRIELENDADDSKDDDA